MSDENMDNLEVTRRRKYARLLLEVGVNLQLDQSLLLVAEPYHWDFLNLLTEEAYKMGAKHVLVEANDPGQIKARVEHSNEENLDQLLSWTEKKYQCIIDERWARINLFGPTDPDLMGALNSENLGIIQKAHSISSRPISDACGIGKVSWCVAAWRDKERMLKERCQKLESLNLAEVKFRGPGTDLSVKCIAGARWIGGGVPIESDPEKSFIPNIPTEECFTTPNRGGTNGRMQAVRPVTVLGKPVTGAWFEFEDGKVISYGAKTNKSVLDDYFAMCPNACYLGELALVDGTSPIFKNGHVFHCILYDENASCHVALGNGYPMPIEGAVKMTNEEKLASGINVSILHTDFMIGGPDVDVTGCDGEGNEIPLIRNGDFVI